MGGLEGSRMKKDEKATVVAELHERFSRAKLAIMTECSGLSGNEVPELRKQLRGAEVEFKVVRNTRAARAVDGTAMEVAESGFTGPLALTIGYEDPVLPTEVLRD